MTDGVDPRELSEVGDPVTDGDLPEGLWETEGTSAGAAGWEPGIEQGWGDEDELEPVDEEPEEEERRRRAAGITPRRIFEILAVVLLLILLGLIAYLLFYLGRGGGLTTRGGSTVAGIKPLMSIEGPGTGRYPRFQRPMGVAFGPDGRIYVADTGHDRICVFDSRGSFLFEFGSRGVGKPFPGVKSTWKPGRLNYPVGIDVDQDGTVYVADFSNDQVQVFDPNGKWLRRFPDNMKETGKGGSGQDGTGIACTDVAVRNGRVYVTDTYQVLIFDTAGRLISQFGKPGIGQTDLDHPNGVAVDRDGRLYVSDSNHARVLAFGTTGVLRWTVGAPPALSTEATASELSLPRGLTTLDNGDIVVVDVFEFDLVRISAAGKIMGRYGERGVDPGQFNFANDVAARGDRLAVADKENDRVQVVQLVTR